MRVRGSVTLYEPGSQLALQADKNAVLIHTHENAPIKIGDVVHTTGFAETGNYAETLDHAQFFPTGKRAPVHPQAVSWKDVLTGQYAFDLISLKGRLIDQVHEPGQDTLFINSGGHVFSSVLRHRDDPSLRLPRFRDGSILQVSGVCFIEKGGPWGSPLGFELHLRDAADIHVVSLSSWWTIRHLVDLIAILGILALAALIWSSVLRRRIRLQTRLLRRGIEAEAIRERRHMSTDKERSRVLEAINSRLPLDQVLAMITELISEQMDGLQCWCEVAATGAIVGIPEDAAPSDQQSLRQFRRDILSSAGERLGSLVLLREDDAKKPISLRSELLDMGVSLAALAIDNRRLYEDLVHRSEYDPLTGVPNRFHLEERLHQVLACARLDLRKFAIIYVDLDRFKAINDTHGHHIGDTYLQNVAKRLSEKLRLQDTLARVGGDEFIVLLPTVRSRAEAEDIATRLAGCFNSAFSHRRPDLPGLGQHWGRDLSRGRRRRGATHALRRLRHVRLQAPAILARRALGHDCFIIEVYGSLFIASSWCRDCRAAKRFLESHGIAYIEIDIEKTPGAADEVFRRVGKYAIPQFVIDGEWVQPYRPGEGFLYEEMRERLGLSESRTVLGLFRLLCG